jgi:flagellar biogenesis protein FliO
MRTLIALSFVTLLVGTPVFAATPEDNVVDAATSLSQKLERVGKMASEREHPAAQESWRTEVPEPAGLSPMRSFEALAICLGVFLIGVHFLKRFNKNVVPGNSKRMKVIERMALSQKTALVLAQVDGKSILLSVGAERVTALQMQEIEQVIDLPMELICQEDKRASAA